MRGTGTTTQQMMSAPQKSLFIWNHRDLTYPMLLAQRIGRSDITIWDPSALTLDGYYTFHGCRYEGIIVDHAVLETPENQEGFRRLMRQCHVKPWELPSAMTSK